MSEPTEVQGTQAQVAMRALELAKTNSQLAKEKTPPVYLSCWKAYVEWVEEMHRTNMIAEGGRHLTRANVDLYFTTVIVNKTFQPATAKRYVYALQWHAKRAEYSIGVDKFEVESAVVKDALRDQERVYREFVAVSAPDPHADLPTDMLSSEEVCCALTAALAMKNWKDTVQCWTTCEQALTRTHSFRQLFICDLVVDHCHGPSETGPESKMLSMVLRKHKHKENANKNRVIGGWRHKNFLRCCTGQIAFALFVRLFDDADNLHFFASSSVNKSVPDWQKKELITGFETEKQAHAAYVAVLTKCLLSWRKITHVRMLGCESASKKGCSDDVIGTMSKHVTRKIARYETELHPKILLVMAGFEKRDTYFVPRIHLKLPTGWLIENLVLLLFPRITVWRTQQAGPDGDNNGKKKCAAHAFLWEVLPFFALVLFQDGIYWLRDFPDHEATRLLVKVLPDWYQQWAKEALADVEKGVILIINHFHESLEPVSNRVVSIDAIIVSAVIINNSIIVIIASTSRVITG